MLIFVCFLHGNLVSLIHGGVVLGEFCFSYLLTLKTESSFINGILESVHSSKILIILIYDISLNIK